MNSSSTAREQMLCAKIVLFVVFAFTCLNFQLLRAQESAPSCCGFPIVLTGDIHHFRPPPEIQVKGGDNPAVFAGEVYGKALTATVPGLPAGTYNVEIDVAELYAKRAGKDLMNITCGDQMLAKELDVFRAAGGFAKAHRVEAKVEHQGDSVNGPLTIEFAGVKGNAKFNAIFIRDFKGEGVASFFASESKSMASPEDTKVPDVKAPAIYLDPNQPLLDARVDDLIRRMSLDEKARQLADNAPSIPRLNLPAYGYWNECLHGVARAGRATVFPQATGMAAMWDAPLMQQIGDTIATEGRAKFAIAG